MICIDKTYQFRLYPDDRQKIQIDKTFEATMFIYNYFLKQCTDEYVLNKKVGNFNRYSAHLKVLKETYPYLKDVDSIALQSAVFDLKNAYLRFLRIRSNYPVMKSEKNSYHTKNINNSIRFEGAKVKIPKLGFVKYKGSKLPQCSIVNATIKRDICNRYYLFVFCKNVHYEPHTSFDSNVRIDLGSNSFCFLSDGEEVKNPGDIIKYMKHIAYLKNKLVRQKAGGKNYRKTQMRINKIRTKISNEYHDFLHQLSDQIIHEYSSIVIVKPDYTDEKYKYNISAFYWNRFIKMIQYKAKWNGNEVKIIIK